MLSRISGNQEEGVSLWGRFYYNGIIDISLLCDPIEQLKMAFIVFYFLLGFNYFLLYLDAEVCLHNIKRSYMFLCPGSNYMFMTSTKPFKH